MKDGDLVEMGSNNVASRSENEPDFRIPFDIIPADSIQGNQLIEIKDSKVLTRINSLVPSLGHAGNATNNAVKAAKNSGEVLYKVVIPSNTQLVKSKDMEGAFRGLYRNAKNIEGQANLVPVEQKVQKGTVAAKSVAAAMDVASVVVGQYYMEQINAQLEKINNGISKISDFQDNEYKGEVFSLIVQVKEIADFQSEILGNNELRVNKLNHLNTLKNECTKLLTQADLTLADFSKKTDLDYDNYEKQVAEAQNWFLYQNALFDVLSRISELSYTLQLGEVSRKQCIALLSTFTKQVRNTQKCLHNWHETNMKRLNIDVNKAKRRRKGANHLLHLIQIPFKKDWNYCDINQNREMKFRRWTKIKEKMTNV